MPVRGSHEGVDPQYRSAGTSLQVRGAGRAYTAAVAKAKVNVELAGEPGCAALPSCSLW